MRTISWFALKIAVCLSLWLLGAPLFAEEGDPPGRVARLSFLNGHVSLQPSGEDQWTDASTNYVATTGDRLYTDQGSRAELEVGPFAIHMSGTTDLTIVNLDDRILQLGLTQGSIRVTVFDLPLENSVEIDTPSGTLTALRPGWYRVDAATGSTLVSVNSGSLQVNGGGVSQTVNAMQAVQLTGPDPLQVTTVSLPNQDEFDEWCAKRDERIRSFAAAQYVNRYIPGVEDLDDHGRWQEIADYGPVWFPAGVAVDWVPYRFGHWVWVEPWGWTWVEDEAWGFCPFHYGRWALIGSVWGWVPGPIAVAPIYGPAFVAFVGGARFSIGFGVGVQAWFPLGPRDPFFPWYHCGREHLLQVNITNVRNVTNITNIINVTNINNIHYAYKEVATTAVPANVFRSGQPVAHSVIRVPPEQLAKAQVVPHPSVAPAREAVFGGRGPINPPPVRAARIVAPPAAHGVQPTPFASRPSAQRPAAGDTQAVRTAPEPSPRLTTPSERPSPPGVERPPFITRTPPPHYNVPFTQREPALSVHPGRPLEPAQRQNLWAGRPAGPMVDREFPPHPPGWKSVRPPRPAAPPERRH